MDLRSPQVPNADPHAARPELNSEAPWDAFDPVAYIDHNYQFLRSDDSKILQVVRKFFGDHFRNRPVRHDGAVRGIDVGAGANLYPALAMLPWCEEITLLERSAANIAYLQDQRKSYDGNWDEFWEALCEEEAYADLAESPRSLFARAARVEAGNLFDLDVRQEQWSMGTMFFVAESMTSSYEEFEMGVERFMRALEPGAPFAAAFMEGSVGYKVGSQLFPACSVTESEIRRSLGPLVDGEVEVTPIGMPGGALRPGYEGMIVACGRRGAR